MEYFLEKKIEDDSTLGYHVEKIKADLEVWAWGVVYKDGTELKQFDYSYQRFHQFGEIQQDNVEMFVMYKTDESGKRIDLICNGNVQYFNFYRNLILDNDTRRVRIYIFGWKNKDNGACSYNYILPDDRLISADHDIADILAFNP
jgi:hypothetical protein